MNDRIENFLAKLEAQLINGNWKLFEFSEEWLLSFDTDAGVYAIKEEGKICYIGETKSIRKTIKDLFDTKNHLLRQSVGNKRFLGEKGYKKGTKSNKFPPKFEEELNKVFEDNFEISVIVVKIGRKELEERLIEKFQPIYNSKAQKKPTESEKSYSVSEIRNTHKKAYRPWDEAQETQLIELHNEGKTTQEIGEIMGRKKGAISSRLKKVRERKENE